jgi:DNA recombination protein RmuC
MIWGVLIGLTTGGIIGWLFAQVKSRNEAIRLASENAELKARLAAEQANGARLEDAGARFTAEFENLANRIFEEKGRTFSVQNQEKLNDVLKPLQGQLNDFRSRVDQIHTEEIKANTSLFDKVEELQKLNMQVSTDAQHLASALKGDSKKQGNWGELVVGRILEESGLQEGIHFERQVHLKDPEGQAARRYPDFVVHLPDARDVVVDSKVSLTAYTRFFEAATEAQQKAAMKEHVTSVRNHIKELAKKDYAGLPGLETIDQVIMCFPNEAALIAALSEDKTLYDDAFKSRLLLVGPSTLLFALRIVDQVWRKADQEKNVLDIADRGQKLYDKFVDFVKDLGQVGESLKKAQDKYDGAFSKLTGGTGNLVRQAEMLKALGVKAKKAHAKELLDQAGANE